MYSEDRPSYGSKAHDLMTSIVLPGRNADFMLLLVSFIKAPGEPAGLVFRLNGIVSFDIGVFISSSWF